MLFSPAQVMLAFKKQKHAPTESVGDRLSGVVELLAEEPQRSVVALCPRSDDMSIPKKESAQQCQILRAVDNVLSMWLNMMTLMTCVPHMRMRWYHAASNSNVSQVLGETDHMAMRSVRSVCCQGMAPLRQKGMLAQNVQPTVVR